MTALHSREGGHLTWALPDDTALTIRTKSYNEKLSSVPCACLAVLGFCLSAFADYTPRHKKFNDKGTSYVQLQVNRNPLFLTSTFRLVSSPYLSLILILQQLSTAQVRILILFRVYITNLGFSFQSTLNKWGDL